MHRTLTFCDFCDAFYDMGRQDQFSYEAKRILFDYIEQYEEDTGERVELDVVVLCCDYNEMSWWGVAENYAILLPTDEEGQPAREECEDVIRAYLQDHTTLCGEFEGPEGVTFVFQVF